ncbi:sugar transferase [Ruminococcus sp.]|uniref:sugar transferase n=1 Tax=Ruminococcus sp. TaxID=41978 RepID=UPI0025F634FA|nr:sugar transferase [Ruminococcus sp.]MCR4639491.1 sugar transferase [Ruminococcus sp.]
MYAKYFKRMLDFTLSLGAIIVLSPILLVLTIVGTVAMGGNPFFTQDRPGKNEKIFKLVKFRTMNNKKDKKGNLLPDEKRLTSYGRLLRSTSLDELPELFNILKGDMAIIGPRPLLVQYLPYYKKNERKRHSVRPGLTGLAQVSGRNFLNWDDRLACDVKYVDNISLKEDVKIILMTIKIVFKKEGISVDSTSVESYLDEERAVMYTK